MLRWTIGFSLSLDLSTTEKFKSVLHTCRRRHRCHRIADGSGVSWIVVSISQLKIYPRRRQKNRGSQSRIVAGVRSTYWETKFISVRVKLSYTTCVVNNVFGKTKTYVASKAGKHINGHSQSHSYLFVHAPPSRVRQDTGWCHKHMEPLRSIGIPNVFFSVRAFAPVTPTCLHGIHWKDINLLVTTRYKTRKFPKSNTVGMVKVVILLMFYINSCR